MAAANTTKKLSFASEEDVQHCYETNGANVIVNVEPRTGKTRGSSMVKLKSIVGYKWKPERYPGHLIAMHKDGQVVAYSFGVENKGMIRVIHIETNKRLLIKGHTAEVFLDVQFSDSKDYNLAAIDHSSLYVFRLPLSEDGDGITSYELLLKVLNPLDEHTPICDKISWCPYIPEFENKDDGISSSLIAWSRGNRFECYSVNRVVDFHSPGEHNFVDITEGIVKSYDDERKLITHVAFSPDGTTLAVSTEDGILRIYQIYFHEIVPKCLYTWNPQNGKKISSFFFLDDFTQPSGSHFWKYMVLLFNDNSELAVYNCDKWSLLQTVKFKSTIGEELEFKTEIDRTSSYLIMSDMTNRQMYVLQILKENALDCQTNGNEKQQNGNDDSGKAVSRVFVSSIAEFNLASSILSYVISNASVKRNKCPFSDNFLIDEAEEFDDDNNSVFCVALKLYLVIPEGVQECHILYQPALGDSPETLPESPIISEVKTDVPPPAAVPKPAQINLMTPEAFSSPSEKQQIISNTSLNASQKDVDQGVLSAIFMLAQSTPAVVANFSRENIVNITDCNMIETEKIVQQKLSTETNMALMKSCIASGASSPSREVRDILLQASDVNEDYYPGEDSDDDEKIEPEKTKEVLEALKNIDVDFENIDEDEDDEDEYDGVSTTDDEIDAKPKAENQNWPQVPQFMDPADSGHATSKEVEVLSKRMNQMIEIMERQSGYIAELRSEIYNVRTGVQISHNSLMSVETNSQKFVDECKSAIGTQLHLSEHRQAELIEKNFRLLENNSRNQIEITKAVIKKTISETVAGKPFTDHISAVILHGLQTTLDSTIRKSMELLIPTYQKLTHEMIREINQVFTAGTKEYMQAFALHLKQFNIQQFQMNDFASALAEIPAKTDEMMKSALVPIFSRHHFDLKSQMDKTEEKILREVRALVKNEIQKGFERQAANLEESVLSVVQRSHCETPAPIVDQKEQIRQQLAIGEVNAAFHLALVSSDLSLLEYTIENADSTTVFEPCPLEQSVLLSLIQQLTAVMSKFNDIKLKYLSSAVMALKSNDPIIREHAPKILKELYTTLNTFRQENPNSSLSGNTKMVMFVAQQMVHSIE